MFSGRFPFERFFRKNNISIKYKNNIQKVNMIQYFFKNSKLGNKFLNFNKTI